MILKNLFRRKGRTLLTLLGIAIGVIAIVALGAVAQGMKAGFSAMTRGSQADLVLTQADTISVLLSSIDQSVADEICTWPEVAAIDGVLLSNAMTGDTSYIFVFGHDPQGFALDHFRLVEGKGLAEASSTRGKPILLGRRAAQTLDKQVGDTFSITGSAFRVVGIYETGSGFEDGAAVIPLQEAQTLTLQPHKVSMLYIQLRSPDEAGRLKTRIERRFPGLSLSTSAAFVDQEQVFDILDGVAMTVAGLAVIIGGIGMANTLFMSVFERTREIGLLRAVGWRRHQVLGLILGESVVLALLGGAIGAALSILAVLGIGQSSSLLGTFGTQLTPQLFLRALLTVLVLGLVGGAYPAWWASHLLPIEALHYEAGGTAQVPRFIPGRIGRDLWRRRTRTLLTMLGIGVSIAAIVSLGAISRGGIDLMTQMWRNSQTDLVATEAGVDVDISAIDERVGARIAARADIEAVSGTILTAFNTAQMPMLIVFGYHPREFAIRHFRIVQGEPLVGRRQVIVGKQAAAAMKVQVGDALRLLNSSFKIVGIYETGLSYEEIGVVIGLREAQELTGKPHQVMMYAIKLRDPDQAKQVQKDLEHAFPEIDFALTTAFAESMSDFKVVAEMVGQISFLAVFIGGLGMLNTMLMSVLERTREIGVLRALGWRRRRILWTILQESLLLGGMGSLCGILLGLSITSLIAVVPGVFGSVSAVYTPQLFVQAVLVALFAGAVGGLYPAWRATRMSPVEALRYE